MMPSRDPVATHHLWHGHGGGVTLGRMDITPGIAAIARWVARRLHAARGLDDDERGQGLVEYGLIVVLIAIVVIVVLGVVGQQVNNVYSNVNNGLAA
jgi:pilus assembly protein Flp/PilA